jgi:CheY-like chemotaxis protein
LSVSSLQGRRVLIVEDEYLIAADLAYELEKLGVEIVGPVASVAEALQLIENDTPDGAVIDINLRGEKGYPVADALAHRRVPFVFATGYDRATMPRAYAARPRCEKPVNPAALAEMLAIQTRR